MSTLTFGENVFLQFYALEEYTGGIILAKQVIKTPDLQLKFNLLQHSEDEIRHGKLWIAVLRAFDAETLPVKGYDDSPEVNIDWFGALEDDMTMLEVLIHLHIHELRVPYHFERHGNWTSFNGIKKVLAQLIAEEASHLRWIREYLKSLLPVNRKAIYGYLNRAVRFEEAMYYRQMRDILRRHEDEPIADFCTLALEDMPKQRGFVDKYLYETFNYH